MSISSAMAAVSSLRSGLVATLILTAGACATQPAAERAPALAPTAAAKAAAPAERNDGLMMQAERGSIDVDDAEETIARHFRSLTRCYDAAGAATTFAQGPVTLHFEIAVDGQTTAVNVESSRLGNYAVESCLTDTARAIRFPRPHGNGRASFEYTLEFRSTAERAVVDLPDEAAQPLRTALLARLLGDCGKFGARDLAATVYVDRRGQVQSAGLAGKTPVSADRAVCATSSFARAPLPPAAVTAAALAGDSLARLTVPVSDAEMDAAAIASRPSRPSKVGLASRVRQRRR